MVLPTVSGHFTSYIIYFWNSNDFFCISLIKDTQGGIFKDCQVEEEQHEEEEEKAVAENDSRHQMVIEPLTVKAIVPQLRRSAE